MFFFNLAKDGSKYFFSYVIGIVAEGMQNIDHRLKIVGIGLSLTAICAQLGVFLVSAGGALEVGCRPFEAFDGKPTVPQQSIG